MHDSARFRRSQREGHGPRHVHAYWLGLRPYRLVHSLQQSLLEARSRNEVGDTLLLVEHTPVITMGRHASSHHLRLSPVALEQRGIELVATNRGGDVTFHGPGQLVAYPILDLHPDWCSVTRYVQLLADTMICLAHEHGVGAGTIDRYPGVWVDTRTPSSWPGQHKLHSPAKLGAIGVRLSRWITMHGLAMNLHTDLTYFQSIVPCGICEYPVTSLHELTGSHLSPAAAAPRAALILCRLFDASLAPFHDLSRELNLRVDLFQTPAHPVP